MSMDTPTIAPGLAGHTIGDAESNFVIAEWQDAGGPAGPPRYIAPVHLHRRDDEAWYVLEGTLMVQQGDEVVEVGAGCSAFVPRGVLHTYWNPGPGRGRYLLVMTSNIFRLIQAIHAMTDRNAAALKAVFEKFDSELGS